MPQILSVLLWIPISFRSKLSEWFDQINIITFLSQMFISLPAGKVFTGIFICTYCGRPLQPKGRAPPWLWVRIATRHVGPEKFIALPEWMAAPYITAHVRTIFTKLGFNSATVKRPGVGLVHRLTGFTADRSLTLTTFTLNRHQQYD